jgi:hypothetical protein
MTKQPDDAIKELLPIKYNMSNDMIAFTQVLRTYCANLKARRTSQSTDTKNKEENI